SLPRAMLRDPHRSRELQTNLPAIRRHHILPSEPVKNLTRTRKHVVKSGIEYGEKFISSPTATDIAVADGVLEPRGKLLQNGIPGDVAIVVVDRPKSANVE